MKLGIILTARCNASCAHCSHDYGPHRAEELGLSQIFELMKDAAEIQDDEPLIFSITGGEPFIDFERLVRVVQHGSDLGGRVYCVTNGFWARNEEIALTKLTQLRAAGLYGLAVSVSRFHQKYVPLHRAQRALRVANELGLFTELKAAVTNAEVAPGGSRELWRAQLNADAISVFPVLPYLRTGEAPLEGEYIQTRGMPAATCPAETITIDFRGAARSCCTPGPLDEFLALGQVQETSVAEIAQRFQSSGRQRVLREKGPVYFALGAIGQGLGHRFRDSYAGPCDLCIHIRSDPELCRVAEAIANEYEQRAAPANGQ